MFADLDLRALADLTGPERAVLSVYLSDPEAAERLEPRFEAIRALLADEPEELEHFEENLKLAAPLLAEWPREADGTPAAGLAVFVCWASDHAQAVPLPVAVEEKVWMGDAAYIRPLAELRDEYEDFAVAVVNNTKARVFVVSAAEAGDERRVRGDVKNRVKKGGWSQKRYARRREKELQEYADEVAATLAALYREGGYSRLVLLGSDEAVQAVRDALPTDVAARLTGTRALDAHQDDEDTLDDAFEVYFEGERADEQRLWDEIREAYLGGGLAVVGATRVLAALEEARAEVVLLDRDARLPGTKCRDCEAVVHGTPQTCQRCGSRDVFAVDLAEALVERATRTGAEVDFTDPFDALADVGHVAALLRY